MATIYRTSEGDVLDLICFKFYGREGMATEVLSANPNLSEYGSILPSNLEIIMPTMVIKSMKRCLYGIRLQTRLSFNSK